MRKKAFVLLFLILGLTASAQDKSYLTLSYGSFDILQQSNESIEARVEYRGNSRMIEQYVSPLTGMMVNEHGALFLYAGAYQDFILFDFLYVTPSFAPGFYMQGASKDLYFVLEFRSQIELSVRLEGGMRIGASFNHISNANLGPPNIGVESLVITYFFPI